MESDMNREESTSALTEYRHQIADICAKMRDIQAAVEPQPVSDYTFEITDGPTRLADLFGVKDDLIVIHNMGTGCAYCRCGLTGSTAFTHTWRTAPRSSFAAPTHRKRNAVSPPREAGAFRW
jgi:predicted dithiol-disulfide oxidoreductase (DUF899 family)